MQTIGIRCSSKDYAYAVLEGAKSAPVLRDFGLVPFPKSYTRSLALRWFAQEIDELLQRYSCSLLLIKAFEGRTRDKSFVERVEHEAVVQLAGAHRNVESKRKVSSTMAKDLGLKGQRHYLETLDTSPIPDFQGKQEKVQDAILVAWSALD